MTSDLLSQYSEYMRREGVSYQEMFRRIKNTLISQRKVIRASGRDTGDAMKLSRDKVTDISHKVVEMLRKNRDLRLKNKDTNAIRLEIVPGDGGCTLTLTDTFDELGKAARDAAGWHECLDRLHDHLDGTSPRPWGERWKEVHPGYVDRLGREASAVGPPEGVNAR